MVELAKKAGIEGDFETGADSIRNKLTEVEGQLIQTKNEAGQDPLNFPPKIDNQFVYLYGHVSSAYGRPTEGSYRRFEDLKRELHPQLDRLRSIIETDLSRFNQTLDEKGASVVMVPKY